MKNKYIFQTNKKISGGQRHWFTFLQTDSMSGLIEAGYPYVPVHSICCKGCFAKRKKTVTQPYILKGEEIS